MKIPKNNQYVLFGGTFVLANKLQAVADKKVSGLSVKQWFLLRNLQDMQKDPPPTITMLAGETDTSRQNTSKMLEVLKNRGYVELCEDSQDRRSQAVKITESGELILRRVASESSEFFKELFHGISEEECQAAAGVVIKLIANLSKMQEETR